MPAWVTYTGLRLLFFAVPLAAVYLLGGNLTLAAVVAAIIGLCLSVIFLGQQRTAAAGALEARSQRRPHRPADEDVEDGAIDGTAPSGEASTQAASVQAPSSQNANTNAAASPKP